MALPATDTFYVAFGTSRTNQACPVFVAYWGNSGQRSVRGLKSYAAIDPQRTLAVHCGNGLMPVSAPIKVLIYLPVFLRSMDETKIQYKIAIATPATIISVQ